MASWMGLKQISGMLRTLGWTRTGKGSWAWMKK